MSLSTTQYGYIVDPMFPFTDDKGKTIKNGFIRVFMAGTSTPVLTYRNYDGATNQEKIELDNSGRVKYNVIGSKGSLYKVVVYNILHSQENPLLTVDKIAVLGASINASGATIVTGLDSVTVPEENFLKATVEGTGVELALDPTEVTSEVSTTAAAVTAAADYVVPLLEKTGTGDSKKISLANLFKFALDWISRLATTITSFANGDFIAVSNPTDGTRKMSKDTLLQLTAQNALGSIHSLSGTATEADLVSGNYLAIDGSEGLKKASCDIFAKRSIQDNAVIDLHSETQDFVFDGGVKNGIAISASGVIGTNAGRAILMFKVLDGSDSITVSFSDSGLVSWSWYTGFPDTATASNFIRRDLTALKTQNIPSGAKYCIFTFDISGTSPSNIKIPQAGQFSTIGYVNGVKSTLESEIGDVDKKLEDTFIDICGVSGEVSIVPLNYAVALKASVKSGNIYTINVSLSSALSDDSYVQVRKGATVIESFKIDAGKTKDTFYYIASNSDKYDICFALWAATGIGTASFVVRKTNNISSSFCVTPEQFGYIDGEDVAVIIGKMISNGFKFIQLLPKVYTVKSTILIEDIVGGCIVGAVPVEKESAGSYSGNYSVLLCDEMSEKAVISLCGCLNFQLMNMLIFGEGEDAANVGIYMGRSNDHKSAQWNNIRGCCIALPKSGNKEYIGIYNNACEEFDITDTSIVADIALVHTDRDCMGLAGLGNNYNFSDATCTVIHHRNMSIVSENIAVMSNVADVTFDNVFYANAGQQENPCLFVADFTNSPSMYWTNVLSDIVSENNTDGLKLLSLDGIGATAHISFCKFKLYNASSVIRNYIELDSINTTVIEGTEFNVVDLSNATLVNLNFAAYNCQVAFCVFSGRGTVSLNNARACQFTGRNKSNGAQFGSWGTGSYTLPSFPFSVNEVMIGTNSSQPSEIDSDNKKHKPGAFCLCTNDSSNIAFWMYKRSTGWQPMPINIAALVENGTLGEHQLVFNEDGTVTWVSV